MSALDQLRQHLHDALTGMVDDDALPALVEEAVWSMSNAAGRSVARELNEHGFPIEAPITVHCHFTIPHEGGLITFQWPVILPPLCMDPHGVEVR